MQSAAVLQTKGRLRTQGVTIENCHDVGAVTFINITNPDADLRQRAIEVTEAFGGIRRRAYIVKFQQCWIIWR